MSFLLIIFGLILIGVGFYHFLQMVFLVARSIVNIFKKEAKNRKEYTDFKKELDDIINQ